jgi:hypothetical protein
MKPKHTPGPWSAWIGSNQQVSVDTGDSVFTSKVTGKTAEANARLIASAPDALSALIEASLEISRLNEAAGETVFNPAVTSMIRAAIAKAEGRGE